MERLLEIEMKVIEEVEPLTEVFMSILSGKYKMIFHVHKEDGLFLV